MKMQNTPTKARWILSRVTTLVAATLLLAACGRDVTAPPPTEPVAAHPSASSQIGGMTPYALVGGVDGTYTLTVKPGQAYTFNLGKSYLSIPANAICSLTTSGYGSSYWNAPCSPETKPVVITAVLRNSQTDNPSIDFSPALRFNPLTNVKLYIYATNAATLANMSVMKYCSDTFVLSSCVDESLTDPSLTTYTNTSLGLMYRRIKHFSGYLIAE